jgi:DNA-binding PadR family transcriptional regulator
MTSGTIRLGPATLYRVIKHMVVDGWIAEVERGDVAGSRRRCYRLTPWGKRIAQAEAQRLATLVRVVESRNLLGAPEPA